MMKTGTASVSSGPHWLQKEKQRQGHLLDRDALATYAYCAPLVYFVLELPTWNETQF